MDLPVACVTVVDAKEGDAFVVDLRVSIEYGKPTAWNRYIIDTGFPVDIASDYDQEAKAYLTGGGPRAGLYQALFDKDITTNEPIKHTIQPWGYLQNPCICGVIITHTDRDHWGNAAWLARYLQWAHQERGSTFLSNPLPIYTSPMIQWLKDVAALSELQLTEKKVAALAHKSEKDAAAKAEAKKFLTTNYYGIKFNKQKPKLGKDPHKIEKENTIETIPFEDPKVWVAAFAKYEALQQALLAEKPYCSLDVRVTRTLATEELSKRLGGDITEKDRKALVKDEKSWIQKYVVSWQHKPLTRTVGCSFSTIPDLAKALGYTIEYRFNLQKRNVKINEPDLTMLMSPLKNDWIKKNTTSDNTLWSRHSSFQPTKDQLLAAGAAGSGMELEALDSEVLVIAEIRLIPPSHLAKRSYPVGANDTNSDLAGAWLRLMSRLSFAERGMDKPPVDTIAVNQINASLERIKLAGLEDELKKKEAESEEQKLLELIVDGWFAEKPAEPGKLVQDVHCLGLQDGVYGLPFVLTPPVTKDEESIYSFWKSTYSGCAGTRFSRDFLHLAAQAYLSPEQMEKKLQKAKETSEALNDKLSDPHYLYYVQLKTLINEKTEKKRVPEDTKNKLETYLKQELQPLIDEKEQKFVLKKKDREEKSAAKIAKKGTKNRSWGHAANRASLITHFRFEALTHAGSGKKISFDMLFTGDAFEIGAGESQPYAPHLRPGLKDFQSSSAVLPRTIEKQAGLFDNPDGNLLSWLYQNGNLGGMRVGVLKVPHHGSSNTTNSLFYRLVSASVYLISGANKPHGHPRPETLQAIINTILREDGPARPPKDFCSQESIDKAGDDKPRFAAVRCLPPISRRPRPRMIFLTHHTCKDMKWDWEKREAEMAKFNGEKSQAQAPSGDMVMKSKPDDKNPSTTTTTKKDDVPSTGDNDLDSSDDDIGDRDPYDDHDAGADKDKDGKKTKKKDYMDVKQFVYFHSQHLGGYKDVPAKDYKKWKEYNRLKRGHPSKQTLEVASNYEMALRANVRLFVQKRPGAASRLMFGFDSSRRDQCRVEWDYEDWYEVRADDHDAHFTHGAANYDGFEDPVAYPEPGKLPAWEMDWRRPKPQDGDGGTGISLEDEDSSFLNLVPTNTPPVMPPGHQLPRSWADQILKNENPAIEIQLGNGFTYKRKMALRKDCDF